MKKSLRMRQAVAIIGIVLAVVSTSACSATLGFSTSSSVESVGNTAAGTPQNLAEPHDPVVDAEPETIVSGFFSALPMGARTDDFSVAERYLTSATRQQWQEQTVTRVYSGQLSIKRQADFVTGSKRANSVSITVSAQQRGQLNDAGTYSAANPSSSVLTYELTKQSGQWRISSLPEGIDVSIDDFDQIYKNVQVYRPSMSTSAFVPDTRWYGWDVWRTKAVSEVLKDPPAWLEGAVANPNTDDVILAISQVKLVSGNPVVMLSSNFGSLKKQNQRLLVRQIRLTLGDGLASTALTITDTTNHNLAATDKALSFGAAESSKSIYVLRENKNISVLTPNLLQVGETSGYPNAKGLAFSNSGGAVVRSDGTVECVTSSAASCGGPFGHRIVQSITSGASGEVLASTGNRILASNGSAARTQFVVPWLGEKARITSMVLSPEGSRLVMVVTDGTRHRVMMTGIRRDAQGKAIGVCAGAVTLSTTAGVGSITFYNDTTLVYVASNADAIGGYQQTVPGPQGRQNVPLGTVALASGVLDGSQSVVALDSDGTLHVMSGSLSAAWVYLDSQIIAISGGDSLDR